MELICVSCLLTSQKSPYNQAHKETNMPNYCCNHLKVTGPKKDLDAFKATLNTKNVWGDIVEFSFNQTVPAPANMVTTNISMEEMARLNEQGIPNWYNWQSENWGCKWDASEVDLDVKPKSVDVRFETAWNPPLDWLKSASKAHPKLTFALAYCERGASFYGEAEAIDGVVNDSCSNIPENCYSEDGEMTGSIAKFLDKHGIGAGG
jgi:hypothetical protein